MPKPATQAETNEVVARPENDRRQRRKFSRAEKLRIVEEAERSTDRGAIAALLRREGIYAGQLSTWREQVRLGGKAGLEPKSPGPKAAKSPLQLENEKLKKRNRRLEHKLDIAQKLIELAGKAHEILGVALPSLDDREKR